VLSHRVFHRIGGEINPAEIPGERQSAPGNTANTIFEVFGAVKISPGLRQTIEKVD
jgi:hypothetical protein